MFDDDFDFAEFSENELTQAYAIVKSFGLHIHNDVHEIIKDDRGEVIAVSFVGTYGTGVEFDIVVREDHHGEGLARKLVENIFDFYEECYHEFSACCVNPAMSHILEKYFNFELEKQVCDTKYMYLEV